MTSRADHRLPGRAADEPPPPLAAWRRYLAPLKPGRGVLLWGGHIRLLGAAAAAWGVARNAPVLVVDAANRFDPYQLVREAQRYGLAPQRALAGVQVARAFTSHQLVRLLQEVVPSPPAPGSLLLILGPVSLFYDEQVPLAERRRLFTDLVDRLARLKAQAALLLLQPLLPKAAANRHFGRRLTPLIDYFVEMDHPQEAQSPEAPPALPALPRRPPARSGRERRPGRRARTQKGDL